jgi:hypothetical protein
MAGQQTNGVSNALMRKFNNIYSAMAFVWGLGWREMAP